MVSRVRAALTVDPEPRTVWALLGIMNGLAALAFLFMPIGFHNRWLFATLFFAVAWAVELANNRGMLTDDQ